MAKGKLEEIPSKSNSNYHAGTTQQLRNSPVESAHVSTRMYCTLLPPNTLLVSLLSVFVEILFCKAELPGPLSLTSGLLVRIWCFHCHDPAQSLVGNPGPAPSCCRLRLPEIISIVRVGCCCLLRGAESFQLLLQGAALPIWSLLLWYSV